MRVVIVTEADCQTLLDRLSLEQYLRLRAVPQPPTPEEMHSWYDATVYAWLTDQGAKVERRA